MLVLNIYWFIGLVSFCENYGSLVLILFMIIVVLFSSVVIFVLKLVVSSLCVLVEVVVNCLWSCFRLVDVSIRLVML